MKRTFQSNADEVNQWIRDFVDTFDFTVEVGSRMLAEDIRDLIAEMIRERSINTQAGANVYWMDNQEPYKSWKLENYGAAHVGELTGQMLSLDSLKGMIVITRDEMTMYYGIDQPAQRFKTQTFALGSARRRKSRQSGVSSTTATDTEKGVYFTDGGRGRPGRPFYELDDLIEDAVYEKIDEFLDEFLT